MQREEIVVYWLILNGCNVILRYNNWYNKTSISMRFIALFESATIYNYLILKHFKENKFIAHCFLDNTILAKCGVKCKIESFRFLIRQKLFAFVFLLNLPKSKQLWLSFGLN